MFRIAKRFSWRFGYGINAPAVSKLPLLNLGIALNAERALTILEHTQLALSLLVERQYPEDVNELIDMALRNVREYHA